MPPPHPAAPLQILHLEDSEADHLLVQIALRKAGLRFAIVRVDTLAAFAEALDGPAHDVILADYHLPGFDALDAWRMASARPDCPPFVLVSGAIGETAAVHAIQQGLSDYLLKADVAGLARVIERSIELHRARLAREQAVAELTASQRRLADLTAHLQTSTDQERAAIAREIHDDIGGSLTAAKFDLAWIGRHADTPALREHAAAATEMIQHALEASQRIMKNLRPAILDQGLVAAIQWLATGFEKRTGIATSMVRSGPYDETTPAIQLVAYRTAQEALTNIAKHAACSQVRIDLSGSEGVLTLEVADNGCGIAPQALEKINSFGLKGLNERAATVDGWLDISSRAGQGTSIILSVPLPAAPAPALAPEHEPESPTA